MAQKQFINKKAKKVVLRSNSKNEFFLIHGYTGSPTDFNELGKYLYGRFDATIKIIRLKGHGERIENIDNLNYNDFLLPAEDELIKDLKKGKNIVLIGMSLGGFIALQLSSEYPVKGIINISIPYKGKFITNLISFFEPLIFKKHWRKPIPAYESEMRKNAFFYDINLRGFKVINQGKNELFSKFGKIIAPCLFINVINDHVFHPRGAEIIKNKINSKIVEIALFETGGRASHNPFYTLQHRGLYKLIGDFVEKKKLFN